jgi:UDP-N-acetylglucosamine:LPS N-acetylglucosamine transferase
VRVLILSADIGEGHDLPARAIRDGLLALRPGTDVRIVDTLAVSGPVMRAGVRAGAETILGRFAPLFDFQYWLAARWGPSRGLASRVLAALAGRGLQATVGAARADVVVCTYPLANEALCVLKARGRIDVPVVSAVTDLAALRFWAHPACDLHLTIHPESDAEIRAIAGEDAWVLPVRGLTSPAFDHPVDQSAARRALGLDPAAPIVVVSGGGWGVGDLGGATRAALAARGDVRVVVLCGRRDDVAAQLRGAFASEPRVTTMGFTDRMSDVLAAGDVLVHSTAGLTVFEALVRGMRVISYGWGVGHVRLNNRAYRRFGLADVVEDDAHLVGAVRRAIDRPRRPDAAYGLRPSAAELVLDAGDGARGPQRAAAG